MIFDTIVAKATADGISAINLIRVSGEDSFLIVQKIFKGAKLKEQKSHTMHYGYLYDGLQQIDEVLIAVFKGPKTYTGEDLIEINCHGGNYLASKIIELLIANGARLALPGEFTKRAYLNKKLDLTKAESIMDLVSAKNYQQLQIANAQLRGDIQKLVENLQNDILDIIASIEVHIDYPEYDDVIEMTNDIIIPNIEHLLQAINKILKASETGQIIREGIKTAIIGRPNVGKSSLLNRLVKEEKAIVTEISGTTRDLVEAELNLDGLILKLIDTAGIRDTEDKIEKIGINRAKKVLHECDLVLLVLDQSTALTELDKELLNMTNDKTRIIIGNKIDLGKNIDLSNEHLINISAKENIGLEDLALEVKKLYIDEALLDSKQALIANSRHIGKIKEAKSALLQALETANLNFPIDLVEIDLQKAWVSLGEITGENSSDDLINNLFSKFCLGK